MVQNILSSEQIYDYFENVVIVAPGQNFKPLGLFQDPQSFQLHCLNPNHKLVHLQPVKVYYHVDFHDFEIL